MEVLERMDVADGVSDCGKDNARPYQQYRAPSEFQQTSPLTFARLGTSESADTFVFEMIMVSALYI